MLILIDCRKCSTFSYSICRLSFSLFQWYNVEHFLQYFQFKDDDDDDDEFF